MEHRGDGNHEEGNDHSQRGHGAFPRCVVGADLNTFKNKKIKKTFKRGFFLF
jgi:hypothetical protein